MTKPAKKKSTQRLSQQEKKEQDAKFLIELQKAQAEDLNDAVSVARRLFGADVDPLVIVAISDRMFDEDGELDEEKLSADMGKAKTLSIALFGEVKGARPDVIVAVYDKVVDVDMGDGEDDEDGEEDEEDDE